MDRRIGAQSYTIRNHTKTVEDLDKACKFLSETGYKIIQLSGSPLEASEIKPILDKYGLQCVVTHKGFADFEQRLDYVIDYNKTLGSKVCGLGMMPKEYMESSAALTEFIKKVNEISKKLSKEGLYFGYHNHAAEFAKLDDGKLIIDRLIDETDEAVTFIPDTFWIQVGGANPVKVIKRMGKRAKMVHFKDFKVDLENWVTPQICEVGCGNLDWDAIIEACDEAGCEFALVEQDTNWAGKTDSYEGDSLKSMKMSYDFLKTKGFN